MNTSRSVKIALSLFLLVVFGCAGASFAPLKKIDIKVDGFTRHYDQSFFEIGDKGIFSIEFVTTEDRMRAGNPRFAFIVHHAVEGDVENAQVSLITTHVKSGKEIRPDIWEDQYGLYDVIGFDNDLPGDWKTTLKISKGDLSDSVTIILPGKEPTQE